MSEPVIVLENVEKKFGRVEALKKVSFTVSEGEVVGFIGPNGAGKSTTLRILLGILKQTSGQARIFGKDVWKEDTAIHQRIAYVPGDVYLWPNLTGGQIIDLLLRLNGQQRTEKTERLIRAFQLDPKKKARTYSKGNRQKVALIAALSQSADLYIFDEPTSGLDPLNERTFQEEVSVLKQAGKSILLSSHILSEVEKMCDRIVIIRQGEIIESGDLSEMRHLTRLLLTVKTRQTLDGIEKQPGVTAVSYLAEDHTQAEITVDRDAMEQLLVALTKRQVVDLTSTLPTLEDLFLRYYENQEGDSHD